MNVTRPIAAGLLLLFGAAGALAAQSVRGRVVDARSGAAIAGALVELRDPGGRSLQIELATPSGAFEVTAPAPGRYLLRVAAIGYDRRAPQLISVPAGGVNLGAIGLNAAVLRLPDLLAISRNRYCGKKSLSDDTFGRLLESARTALDVLDETIASHRLAFVTRLIHSRTIFGMALNTEAADTTLEVLTRWPVESIDPDTLRVFGFERTVRRNGATVVEFYGPDARVLFSDWFLDDHCFQVAREKHPDRDTLRITFTPARKSSRVDLSGELLLDPHNLALLGLDYTHENLPKWMKKHSAGGTMTFLPLPSGLWITTHWALWGPIEGESIFDPSHPQMAGMSERRGDVLQVIPADSVPAVTGRGGQGKTPRTR